MVNYCAKVLIALLSLIVTLFAGVNGQAQSVAGANAVELNAQAQKLIELYGLATQLMNIGGSIINNAKDVYGNTGSKTRFDNFETSGNGILGEYWQPRSSGVETRKPLVPLSEYGGGVLGAGNNRVQSARQSGIEALINQFLGPSFFGTTTPPSKPNLFDFFKPSYHTEDYQSANGGSNIDQIIGALMRSGAKRATPDPHGSQNLLQGLFGKR